MSLKRNIYILICILTAAWLCTASASFVLADDGLSSENAAEQGASDITYNSEVGLSGDQLSLNTYADSGNDIEISLTDAEAEGEQIPAAASAGNVSGENASDAGLQQADEEDPDVQAIAAEQTAGAQADKALADEALADNGLSEEQNAAVSTEGQELPAAAADEKPVQNVIDGKKYLMYSDESCYTGWYDMTADWRLYFDPAAGGAAAVGIYNIDGVYYYFNEDGLLIREAGTPVVDGEKYWIDTQGIAHSGWLYLGNWKMYFDPESMAAAVGFKVIDGKTYLFNNDGVMQTYAGTTIVNGEKYWFSTDDASLKTGWLHLANWKLYFDPETFAAYTGVHEVDGKYYVFNEDGVVNETCGTPVVNGKKYWTDSDGSLRSGWLQLGPWLMYFYPDTFTCPLEAAVIDGVLYDFDDNGIVRDSSGSGFDDDGLSVSVYNEAGRICVKYDAKGSTDNIVFRMYLSDNGPDDYKEYIPEITSDGFYTAWIDRTDHTADGLYKLLVIKADETVCEKEITLSGFARTSDSGSLLLDIGTVYLGTPYYWGGCTPTLGFDCSGFIDWCYYLAGCDAYKRLSTIDVLNNYSGTSYDVTPALIAASALQAGDLVLIDYGGFRHIVMYAGGEMVIGASGGGDDTFADDSAAKVRYDTLASYTGLLSSGVQIKIYRIPVSVW